MSKRSCFRTPLSSQRVSEFEILLKPARHNFHPIIPLIKDNLSWKTSFLVRSEILGLFVNTLTADDKYSRRNMENVWQIFQMELSQKQKHFSPCFITFMKSTSNFKHLKRKMGLLA